MSGDDSAVGTLEQEALKRKERLKSLKRKYDDAVQNPREANVPQSLTLPMPKFRNYKPQDENLKANILPEARAGDVDSEVQEQLEAADEKVPIDELDLTDLAPRKPDWDLKRDVAKKLEILERRTQKAIAELIRDRLKKREDNLATLVNIAAKENMEGENNLKK